MTTLTSSRQGATLLAIGAGAGALLILSALRRRRKCRHCRDALSPALELARDRRVRLPSVVVLVRHGESEGNADLTLLRTKADNLIRLTEKGLGQAEKAGKRIEAIFQKYDDEDDRNGTSMHHGASSSSSSSCKCASRSARRAHLIVSPFERTRQTAAALRTSFEHRIVRTDLESRIREQEFGNLQGDDFVERYRQEQRNVGRFWYRFPTGESGADVYDRVKSWWTESVLTVNERIGFDPVDALVVVTHGLTMRFVLMQLYGWSPTTLQSVWNAGNCDVYVLRKDLNVPGHSPYVLDCDAGDMPRSSIDLVVKFKSTGEKREYRLEDYLTIPPPRTTRLEMVKDMLAKQHSIDKEDIAGVKYMPFVVSDFVKSKRFSSGSEETSAEKSEGHSSVCAKQREKPEMLCGFPNHPWPAS